MTTKLQIARQDPHRTSNIFVLYLKLAESTFALDYNECVGEAAEGGSMLMECYSISKEEPIFLWGFTGKL